eukprot:5701356-Amphidinium_carterae.2
MLVILLLGHYVACGWVILAEQQGSLDENNWVTYGSRSWQHNMLASPPVASTHPRQHKTSHHARHDG